MARTDGRGAPRATVTVPGSKSLTNRELILAALADGPSRLAAPLHSEDSARMIDALHALGVAIERAPGTGKYGDDLVITPVWPLQGSTVVDCGQAGTVMRCDRRTRPASRAAMLTLTAHESALHRPMGTMIKALRDVGVDIDDGGHWSLPFTVRGHGHVRGGEVVVDASASSQFVSGLLLAAPRFDVGLHLIHRGERLPSMPHIDMTVESLAHRGVHVERPAPGEWVVPRARVAREGRRDRARSLQCRAVPRRGDDRRRTRRGDGMARALRHSRARCSPRSSRSWALERSGVAAP